MKGVSTWACGKQDGTRWSNGWVKRDWSFAANMQVRPKLKSKLFGRRETACGESLSGVDPRPLPVNACKVVRG